MSDSTYDKKAAAELLQPGDGDLALRRAAISNLFSELQDVLVDANYEVEHVKVLGFAALLVRRGKAGVRVMQDDRAQLGLWSVDSGSSVAPPGSIQTLRFVPEQQKFMGRKGEDALVVFVKAIGGVLDFLSR